MKLNRLFGFVLLAALVVAISGTMNQTGYAIPTGTADFDIVPFTAYFGGATSLPYNPGQKDVVIAAFALIDCNGGAFGGGAFPGGSTLPAGCANAVADGNRSIVKSLQVQQITGSAPAGTFTNVRAYIDSGTNALGVVRGRGTFNLSADTLLGTFSGDVATGATLNIPAVGYPIDSQAGVVLYIVADVSPSARLGDTALFGLSATTDDVVIGGAPQASSTLVPSRLLPVQDQLQVAIGGAQTGTARGIAADVTTQVNVVNNITPTVPANTQQIMQIVGICAEAINLVPAPSSGGSIFIGTLYPQCVSLGNAANGLGLALQIVRIHKIAGSLPSARVHLYIDRNGNNLPDASEEIGQGFPWPNTNVPVDIGSAGNPLLAGPAVGPAAFPIVTAAGLLTAPTAFGGGPGGNECGAANLLAPSNAASATGCGINLIITVESDQAGDLQIGSELIAGDIPRLGVAFVGTNVFQTPMPVRSLVRATFQGTGGPGPGPGPVQLVASVGKPPRRPSKTMTYKDVFVSATGPAGASKMLTGFSVPGCTVSKVTGPALPVNVVVGGAPVGPFKVKVKCATKPGSVPGLTPLRVGGESDTGVPSLIPLKAGSVGTVEIFTLTGKKVLETGFSGGALDATKLDLPNGVYLYVVKTITPEGVVQSELRKLVVKN